MMQTQIRIGDPQDLDHLIGLDPIAQTDPGREALILNALNLGNCYLAEFNQQVIGYGILSYSFYGHGMIELMIVRAQHRRRGVGTKLVEDMAGRCKTPKLFTSTNQSNLPMQALLARCGFDRSGIIENIDEGDPELIFFRRLS